MLDRPCKNCIQPESTHKDETSGPLLPCQQFIPDTPPWDDTFMDLARVMASRSKDRSSAIGAVIVDPGTKAPISQGSQASL